MLKRRTTATAAPAIPLSLQDMLLEGEPRPIGERHEGYDILLVYTTSDAALKALWRLHGGVLTAAWLTRHPGTRPVAWWRYDAPEPLRRRLGGIGDSGPFATRSGLPACWSTSADDPPRFESEAAFLDRHGLLTDGEKDQMTADDFAPIAFV